jgi:hypothetical protein
LEVFEGERRGREGIFLIKYVWFNFYKGRGGEQIIFKTQFLFPPKLERFGADGREAY